MSIENENTSINAVINKLQYFIDTHISEDCECDYVARKGSGTCDSCSARREIEEAISLLEDLNG